MIRTGNAAQFADVNFAVTYLDLENFRGRILQHLSEYTFLRRDGVDRLFHKRTLSNLFSAGGGLEEGGPGLGAGGGGGECVATPLGSKGMFHHIELRVGDIEKSLEFYQKVKRTYRHLHTNIHDAYAYFLVHVEVLIYTCVRYIRSSTFVYGLTLPAPGVLVLCGASDRGESVGKACTFQSFKEKRLTVFTSPARRITWSSHSPHPATTTLLLLQAHNDCCNYWRCLFFQKYQRQA